jgi:hypothetical protein
VQLNGQQLDAAALQVLAKPAWISSEFLSDNIERNILLSEVLDVRYGIQG